VNRLSFNKHVIENKISDYESMINEAKSSKLDAMQKGDWLKVSKYSDNIQNMEQEITNMRFMLND